MREAALLAALACGGAAAVWGHVSDRAGAFYAGTVLLVAALGPLAFAAGRRRWPAAVLRGATALATGLFCLLGVEGVWALARMVSEARAPAASGRIFTYAEARQHPGEFRRWWQYRPEAVRGTDLTTDDPSGRNPFVLAPGIEVMADRSRIRINSLGFRGEEIALDRGDAFRIVALGESTTFGFTLLESDRTWPEVLEDLIRDELGCAAPVELVNGGVLGWTLGNQLRRLEADVLPLQPDLVVSYHGYNGFNFLFTSLPSMLVQDPPGEVTRPSHLLAALENALARRRFLQRYDAARELAREVPEVDLRGSAYTRLYRKLARRLAAHGIPLAVATFNMAVNDESPDEVIHFYEQTFPDVRARMLANRMHTKLVLEIPLGEQVIPIDTRQGLDGQYETLYIDAAHFTQAGRERLAANILAGLRDFLVGHPRMRCGETGARRTSGDAAPLRYAPANPGEP